LKGEKVNSFNVERFMFYEGRRLYGFRVEALSRPGVIAAVSTLIAERGLDITYFSSAGSYKLGEPGEIIFFIDFTDSDVKPETLAMELKALDVVTRVELIRPRYEGFIADTASFPIRMGRRRAIILSESALRGLLIEFRRRLGSGGEAMLYHIGREVGAERARNICEMTERIGATGLRDKFDIGVSLLQCMGYGIPEILELRMDPPYLRERLHRCIECELGRGSNRPFSHFVRGIIAGYASELFKINMIAEETRCIAIGDPYCEFEVKPRGRPQGW